MPPAADATANYASSVVGQLLEGFFGTAPRSAEAAAVTEAQNVALTSSPAPVPKVPLGLPGVANRRENDQAAADISSSVTLLQARDAARISYVTSTCQTPFDDATKPKPVPIASRANSGDAATDRMYPCSSLGPCSKPKARAISVGNTDTPMSMISSSPSQTVVDESSKARRIALRRDSNASVRWKPDILFVRSKHQKLSETYRDYDMVQVLGEGRSGAVFIVQHNHSERYYACKVLSKCDHDAQAMREEIEVLRSLDHPNVVRLYETNEDQDAVFLLMEYCQGGDLFARIVEQERLREREARVFAQQMLSALAYCHKVGVAHRDVKPENLLLMSSNPDCLVLKLCDFGIATRMRSRGVLDSHDAGQVNGSLPYMAPELFQHSWGSLAKSAAALGASRHACRKTLAAGDLWSVGVVIYVMLSGDLPFGDDVDMICSGQMPDCSGEAWRDLSGSATDLIRRLVRKSVEERWTAKQALAHEWLQEGSSVNSDHFGCEVDCHRGELARELLRRLQRWKSMSKLKRMCIASIAKRLEADHMSQRLAQLAYQTFAIRDVLRCDVLVNGIVEAVGEEALTCMATPTEATEAMGGSGKNKMHAIETPSSSGLSAKSPGSGTPLAKAPQNYSTLTGMRVRQRVQGMVRRISRISEDAMLSGTSAILDSPASDKLAINLTELPPLVASLDAVKNGVVDYTLLVAAVMTEETYCDDERTAEAFAAFDVKKQGCISPECLVKAFRSKDASIQKIADMIAPFDLNNDGVLDLFEFRQMLRDADGEDGKSVRKCRPTRHEPPVVRAHVGSCKTCVPISDCVRRSIRIHA